MLNAPELAWQLQQRREDLVFHLFPDARYAGNELRWHGPHGGVWSMVIRGAKAGRWANWAAPREIAGDALDLVHHALYPNETGRRESCQWAARWLGLEDGPRLSLEQLQAQRRAANDRAEQRRTEERAERERQIAKGRALYERFAGKTACPEIDEYLLSRGIDVAELASYPRSLRFAPEIGYDHELRMPAMLAPVVHPVSRTIIGCHRTYLHRGPNGWRKAVVKAPKKMKGAYHEGLIPLLRGGSGKPFSEAPYGDTILIAEGIENALAASLGADGEPRVVACISVGNLPEIKLPPAFRTVILAYDRDGENEDVRRNRDRALAQLLAEKRVVYTAIPDPGIKDFSDLAVARNAA